MGIFLHIGQQFFYATWCRSYWWNTQRYWWVWLYLRQWNPWRKSEWPAWILPLWFLNGNSIYFLLSYKEVTIIFNMLNFLSPKWNRQLFWIRLGCDYRSNYLILAKRLWRLFIRWKKSNTILYQKSNLDINKKKPNFGKLGYKLFIIKILVKNH